MRQAAQRDEIASQQGPVDGSALRQIRDAPGPRGCIEPVDPAAVEHRLASIGRIETGEQTQQGGLARTVGADDRAQLPARESDLDPIEHRPLAPAADQRVRGKHRHVASHEARARRITRTRNGAPTSEVKTPSCSS